MSFVSQIFSKIFKLIILVLILAIVGGAWYGWYESTPLLEPHSQPKYNVSSASAMSLDYFDFYGADGKPVKACIVKSSSNEQFSPRQSRIRDLLRGRECMKYEGSLPGVVLIATTWDNGIEHSLPYAEALTSIGYTCILWEPWGNRDDKQYCSYGYREADDVSFLLDAAEKKLGDLGSVAAFGKGVGASTLMLASVKEPRIRSLVVADLFCNLQPSVLALLQQKMSKPLSYGAYWLIDVAVKIRAGYSCSDVVPVDAAGQISLPVMLVSSDEFPLSALKDSLTIYESLQTPLDKRSVYVPLLQGEPKETKTREHITLHELKNGQIKEEKFTLNLYDGDDELMANIVDWITMNTMPPLPTVLLKQSPDSASENENK